MHHKIGIVVFIVLVNRKISMHQGKSNDHVILKLFSSNMGCGASMTEKQFYAAKLMAKQELSPVKISDIIGKSSLVV